MGACALFPKEFVIGNLKEQSYQDVFHQNSESLIFITQSPQKGRICIDGCNFRDYCAGCYLKGTLGLTKISE